MRFILLIFCLFAVTACDENTPTGPSVPLNQQFTLAPGEAVRIEATPYAVRFVRVSNDSRCPGDAICITGGDALVHIQIFDGTSPTEYELHTGDERRGTVTHATLRVGLVQVQPYPFASLPPIKPGDYRVTLQTVG
jgi:hypothetical protein